MTKLAIAIIEAASAAAVVKPVPHVSMPGDTTKPITTGQPAVSTPVPAPIAKPTKVIRAADLSDKSYLETEADVDAYLSRLKAELLTVVRAGQKARVQ